MEPLRTHTGVAAPLPRADVDTDQIIPKQFLKRIERTGYGDYLFWDWSRHTDGTLRPDFALNRDALRGASILVTGENFGCGSSREHAAWALKDRGFRVVLAPSFADIFRQNADSNGLAALTLDADAVETLLERAAHEEPLMLTVDLEVGTVSDASGVVARFTLDDFRRTCLLEGLDRIALTLRHEADIAAYEASRWPAS
jgi:3-isopropylmalate/(R)-2-methylmalate dehydratase small subunit